jgi:hypothetical protein
MKILLLLPCLLISTFAEDCRVLVDGTGCNTRQLAVARILKTLPGVTTVEILPRAETPALNQRYFVIHSTQKAPSREQLIEALGRRATFYHVIAVTGG